MRAFRSVVLLLLILTGAIVIQTTVFGRFRIFGAVPDLVLLLTILSALRLRDEGVLFLGFAGGLVMDALSTGALGLRALVYTVVAYLAVRTRSRADSGPVSVALWAGALTAVGVVLVLLVGSIFSQAPVSGGLAVRTAILVPILNTGLALIVAPVTSRLLASIPGGRR